MALMFLCEFSSLIARITASTNATIMYVRYPAHILDCGTIRTRLNFQQSKRNN